MLAEFTLSLSPQGFKTELSLRKIRLSFIRPVLAVQQFSYPPCRPCLASFAEVSDKAKIPIHPLAFVKEFAVHTIISTGRKSVEIIPVQTNSQGFTISAT